MPSLRQSSAMLTSPRRPSSTMRIFSSAECADAYFYGCPGLSSSHCPVCACLLVLRNQPILSDKR